MSSKRLPTQREVLVQPAMVQESSKGPALGSPFMRLKHHCLYTSAKFSSWKYPILLAPIVSKMAIISKTPAIMVLFHMGYNSVANVPRLSGGLIVLSSPWPGGWCSCYSHCCSHRIIQECLVWSVMLRHPAGKRTLQHSAGSVKACQLWSHRADPRRRMQNQKDLEEKKDLRSGTFLNITMPCTGGSWHESVQVWSLVA